MLCPNLSSEKLGFPSMTVTNVILFPALNKNIAYPFPSVNKYSGEPIKSSNLINFLTNRLINSGRIFAFSLFMVLKNTTSSS